MQDEGLHRQRTGEVITQEYARDALDKRQVLVDLPPDELSRRAVGIYRRAQTALQEGGANTLYLALGFLLWKRNQKDKRRFRAPLILLPVTLIRKSVRSGIRMLAHDDEPRFNTTLLEMLRKDFQIDIAGLDGALPADESGVDVNWIWNKIRTEVRDAPGFEVSEEVFLGHFSFAKYLMWKDLIDRTEALKKNAIVRHLIDTPREPYPSDISFVDGSKIDREYKPSDLLAPLSADSSQMAAIATADRGKDFVIIGPPGTGKSQTISNLIAHMLGKGRTVLFVSEKTAALEVVYRRMTEIGLGPFCLELHSNKARKLDVLNQLGSAWASKRKELENWKKEAERLRRLRDQLNQLVDRLHLPRRNGMTAYEAIGVKVRDEELAARVQLSWPSADHHDAAHVERMRETVEKLRVQAKAVEDVSASSPFRLVAAVDWSPQWRDEVAESASALSASAQRLARNCSVLLETVGITVSDQSMSRIDAIAGFSAFLKKAWRKQAAFSLRPDGPEIIEAIKEAIERLQAYQEARSSLSCTYDPTAWRNLCGVEIARRWQAANKSWWPKRIWARRSVVRQMIEGGAEGTPDPGRDAGILKRLREEGEGIDRLNGVLSEFKDWRSHDTNPAAMASLKDLGERARVAVGKLADDAHTLLEHRAKIRLLLHDGNDLLAPDACVGQMATKLLSAHQQFCEACEGFQSLAGRSVRKEISEVSKALDEICWVADTVASRKDELQAWCGWRRRRMEALGLELGPIVNAIENGSISVDEIENTFEVAYCNWFSAAVIGEDEVLRRFSTHEHDANIRKFRLLDEEFQRLTAEYIGARLAGRLPESDDVTRKSSWGILRHELQKQRRHKPVRRLMEEIPDVITTLSPCLMMSPLSVAQYLSAEQTLFDAVIFDEASQITVWDAVGCLSRARQAIVVGDPRQMPPTNFFARADDDPEGDIDVEGDLESILDQLLGASIPSRTLNLHYRSRRESLIAFSNGRYYDNELITFPAPVRSDNGLRLMRPDGFYARGGARHNQGEAKAIVAEILRRLTHENRELRKMSIGVVTFNSQQQTLIENLLDSERSRNPEIEWAFSADRVVEPLFVKNLETVQGDERDVILFSVTYGPDRSDHVTMNFGPLNRTGGERRLNVALTRARSEMLVFSTLSPDRILLSRTQARAVADLKHFLEYADRGVAALGRAVYGPAGDFDSPFEQAVARALRERGWHVHPQVGVSAYRIDLGIVDPDKKGAYLAGIECDGAMYHSSAYARERDKIRQSVLEGLGWKLFRVWSTDWWIHQSKALDTLHEALTNHLKAVRQEREEALAAAPERQDAGLGKSALKPGRDDADRSSRDLMDRSTMDLSPGKVDHGLQEDGSERRGCEGIAALSDTGGKERIGVSAQPDERGRYSYLVAGRDDLPHAPDPDAFYSEEYVPKLTGIIECVIDTEGPIHEKLLRKRIARYHGFQRAGRKIADRVIRIAKRRRGRTEEGVGIFFWPKGTVRERLVRARWEGRDIQELRDPRHICREEIQAINQSLLVRNNPLLIARKIGVARLRQSARKRILDALASQPDSVADGSGPEQGRDDGPLRVGISTRPDKLSRAIRSAASATPTAQLYRRYWKALLPRLQELAPQWSAMRTPARVGLMSFRSARSDLFLYNPTFFVRPRFGYRIEVRIHCPHPNVDPSEVFDWLKKRGAEIESEMGREVEWDRMEGRLQCRISIYYPEEVRVSEEHRWDDLIRWTEETMSQTKSVFDPIIRSFPG